MPELTSDNQGCALSYGIGLGALHEGRWAWADRGVNVRSSEMISKVKKDQDQEEAEEHEGDDKVEKKDGGRAKATIYLQRSIGDCFGGV